MPSVDLTAYQCQSFRCGYYFIWRKHRVSLDFQAVILTIPEFAFLETPKVGAAQLAIIIFQKLDRSAITLVLRRGELAGFTRALEKSNRC